MLILSAAVSGVALGLLYGLIGLAIVMLYKSTGVANFAQGTLATLGAFVGFALISDLGLPLYLSIALSLVISALIGVIVFVVVMRPRPEAGNLNQTVRTLALSLLVLAVMDAQWPRSPYRFPAIIEGGGVTVAGVVLPGQNLLIAAVSTVVAVLLWAFFKYTNVGLSLRAMAEQAETASLLGLRSSRLGATTWAISCTLGAIVALLLAPSAFLFPSVMDSYMMFVFTGIVLGGLTSLPGALVGCVIVGVISNVTVVSFNFELSVVVVFVLMLTGMLLRPQGLMGKPAAARL
jgi:branched-chain amino acid transport system permease protein